MQVGGKMVIDEEGSGKEEEEEAAAAGRRSYNSMSRTQDVDRGKRSRQNPFGYVAILTVHGARTMAICPSG